MTFKPKKFDQVFEDMRDRTTVISDFEVGSVARTVYESFAYEIALLYEKMQLVYLSAYVDTAQGQQLDMVVSVLGIQRGLPDFAVGKVTFERDVGNEDIEIPLGTLVSTEDAPEAPKKVYQTFEAKTLLKDHTSLDVKVQAVSRGEDQVAATETIVVMPRPIPGIKAVMNQKATEFVGKRRESDAELRQRAKNALISSGKATIVSIENALLSLSGVKDVKVNENFHFAQGEIELQRTTVATEIIVPKGTVLTANEEQPFETIERAVLEAGADSVKVTVRSSIEGQAGQVVATQGVTWKIEGDTDIQSLSASNPAPILLGDFGIIEVFVDIANFDQEKPRLQAEIDRVRAAGIFVLLKSSITINVDGVFKIQINPDLKLAPEDRAALEETVREEIKTYILEQKMGQPLLFSQIIKNVLSLDGINDLEDFIITTHERDSAETPLAFAPSDKRIDVQEFEKLNPRHICVASETKPLPVHVQFQAQGLNDITLAAILAGLGTYFDGREIGDDVQKSEIESEIEGVAGITDVSALELVPGPWCSRASTSADAVEVSFVEQAKLGDVFAYHSFLNITGALKLTLPTTMTSAEKTSVYRKIKTDIETYLESLKSEADVVFEDLIAIAAAVDRVLAVDLTWQDFRVALGNEELPERVTKDTKDKIEIRLFEKARLKDFCITGDVETVRITVDKLELNMLVSSDPPPAGTVDPVKLAVKNAVNNFLTGVKPGQDLVYANLLDAIQNRVPGANYNVQSLDLTATSACDGRTQQTDMGTARDIHVRSVEIATMQPISGSDVVVTFTVMTPPDE